VNTNPKYVIEVRKNDTYLEVYEDFIKVVQKDEEGFMKDVSLTKEELFSLARQVKKEQ